MTRRWQAHLPWLRRHEYLSAILDLDLAPEIAFKGPDLDAVSPGELRTVASLIAASGRRPTVHAPFFDLFPGAMDPLARQIALHRLTQAVQAAGELGAHLMVVHPGYHRWLYPNLAASWVEHAAATFGPLAELGAQLDCRLALENIYEEETSTLAALVARLDSPWFGHCFDIGHWRLFGRESQQQWLEVVAPQLLHLHLHDNHGQGDDHLPVGEGTIDFSPLIALLGNDPSPPSITLEAHDPGALQRSLHNLDNLLPRS